MLHRIHSIVLAVSLAGPLGAADCGNPATAKEVLDCVLKNDPRVLASAERVKRAQALSRQAGAITNPEVEGEYQKPQAGNGERISASLTQRIDWGNGAKAAQLEWEAARAEDKVLRQEVLGETVLRLVRLTQIGEEKKLIEGQLRLCEKGLQRFKGLAFLTAEQRAGKQALEWGQERLKLEILGLDEEAADIRLEFAVSLGASAVPALVEIAHKEAWPPWPSLSAKDPSILLAEKRRSESLAAETDKEAALGFPSLSLGPVFEKEGQENFFGGRLSLGLPIFDRNEGRRDAAQAAAREGDFRRLSVEKRLALGRGLLRERYSKAVERLAGLEEMVEKGEGKLAAIRADYLEGRLQLPLAFESYREMEELLEHFHETERTAYGTLWRGYALEDVAEDQTP